MKRLLIFLTIIFCTQFPIAYSQNSISASVDERVELMSIVFRIAGSQSYAKTTVEEYSKQIDQYFEKYKNDKLIDFTKNLIRKNEIAYDAVVSMAMHLKIENGQISLNQDLDALLPDERWGKDTDKFISLLNVFYTASNFHQFYFEHENLYSLSEKNFEKYINAVDIKWFQAFYDKEVKDNFKIILQLAAGGSNYGQKIKYNSGQVINYALLCTWETDSLGIPEYELNEIEGTTVHEFNHSFCNPLLDKYYLQIENSANECYKLVREKMESEAYGEPEIMVYEAFVRATAIMYEIKKGLNEKETRKRIRYEQFNGFIWMEELVSLLKIYETERTTYPTLETFMPVIIEKINSLDSKKIAGEVFCKGNAEILKCSIPVESIDVDPKTDELRVYFSMPMSGGFGSSPGKGGQKNYPEITSVKWLDDPHTELIISIKLQPGKFYSIEFPSRFNLDENYCEMSKSYSLNFKTKK